MAKINIPGSEGTGASKFLNLALSSYLSTHFKDDSQAKALRDCVYNPKVQLFLTDLRTPGPGSKELAGYDLVGFEEGQKEASHFFTVNCDTNLQVKGVSVIDREELSPASAAMYDSIKSGELDEPAPTSPSMR